MVIYGFISMVALVAGLQFSNGFLFVWRSGIVKSFVDFREQFAISCFPTVYAGDNV